MTMECGETITQPFFKPTDSAADAVSKPDICGPRTYEVKYMDDTEQTLITIETLVDDTDF